jgi:hypothetical protein
VSDDRRFAAVFSSSGGVHWPTSFLEVSVFKVKTLRLTLVAVPSNDGFLVVSLLKALFGDWTFSRVKTQDLPLMVRPGDDGVCALFHSRDVVLEYLFRSIGVIATDGALAVVSLCLLQRGFFLFFFCLCVSLMSRLALDIMLLHRLSVIGIILILDIPFIEKATELLHYITTHVQCSYAQK